MAKSKKQTRQQPSNQLKEAKLLLKHCLEILDANCDCGCCGPCELADEVANFLGVKGREREEQED